MSEGLRLGSKPQRVRRHKSIEDLLEEQRDLVQRQLLADEGTRDDGVQCLFDFVGQGEAKTTPARIQALCERLFGMMEDTKEIRILVDSVSTTRSAQVERQQSLDDLVRERHGGDAAAAAAAAAGKAGKQYPRSPTIHELVHRSMGSAQDNKDNNVERRTSSSKLMAKVAEELDQETQLEEAVIDIHGFRMLLDIMRNAFREFVTEKRDETRLHKFDAETMKQLTLLFKKADTDASGEIEKGELLTLMNSWGSKVTEAEVEGIISKLDLDRSGTLSLEEFLGLASAVQAKSIGDEASVEMTLRSHFAREVSRIRGLNLRAKLAVDAATVRFLRTEVADHGTTAATTTPAVVAKDAVENAVRRAREGMSALGGDDESTEKAAQHMRCRAVAELDAELLEAAEAGRVDKVRTLVQMGANVEHTKNEPPKETALILALGARHVDCALALLGLGADAAHCDETPQSPLVTAVFAGCFTKFGDHKVQTLLPLLATDAVLDLACDVVTATTPLIAAAQRLNDPLVHWLLKRGAQPNLTDAQGRTALIHASQAGLLACARTLVEGGADVNVVDDTGKTARDRAEDHGKTELAQYLRDHAAVSGDEVLNLDTTTTTITITTGTNVPPSQQKRLNRRNTNTTQRVKKTASMSEAHPRKKEESLLTPSRRTSLGPIASSVPMGDGATANMSAAAPAPAP